MDTSEICFMFRHAKDRQMQIHILADLTLSDDETIIEILKDNNLCVKQTKCRKCAQMFNKYLDPYCEPCRIMVNRAKQIERSRQAWVRQCIAENEALRQDYLKKAADLLKENTKLVEWLV